MLGRMNCHRLLPATHALLCAGAALAPAAAHASTVTRAGDGTLVYTAAPGERNRIGVQSTYDELGVVFYDSSGTLTAGPDGCTYAPASSPGGVTSVTCPAKPSAIRVELGDGDDEQYVSLGVRVPITVLGGAGNDNLQTVEVSGTLDGGPGNDRLDGDRGDDTLLGGDGNDTIEGEVGSDHVDGGAGDDHISGDGSEGQWTDVIDGGPGTDTIDVDWSDRTYDYVQPHIRLTLGGGADDGRPGENDDVRGVERIILGIDGDIVGTDAAETLEFHQITRAVRIDAGGGDDVIQGGEGNDVVNGGAGNDDLDASFGDDVIDPGPGRDVVFADLRGGDCGPLWCKDPYGNDIVNARDGEVDSIDCGVGTDKVIADADDVVNANCETVERAGAVPRPGGDDRRAAPRPSGSRVTARVAAAKLGRALTRGLVVRVAGAKAGTRVALIARRGTTLLASGSAKASKRGAATVTLRFNRFARRSLRRAKKVTLTVAGAGVSTKVTLKR
jgi:Ca2+-binding RTX toxin-like protein